MNYWRNEKCFDETQYCSNVNLRVQKPTRPMWSCLIIVSVYWLHMRKQLVFYNLIEITHCLFNFIRISYPLVILMAVFTSLLL